MSSRRDVDPIPNWKLERFLLGELDADEMNSLRHRVAADGSLAKRLEALKQSNRELHERYPVDIMSRQIEQKLATAQRASGAGNLARSWRLPRLALVPAAALAVLACLFLVNSDLFSWLGLRSDPGGEVAVIRHKGTSASLQLHRKTDFGSERLPDGARAAARDLIMIQYRADEHAYGVIFSVDGRGVVTRQLPVSGDRAMSLAAGELHSLDSAYELDDAPRWEVFVFVTSPKQFSLGWLFRTVEDSPLLTRHDLPPREAATLLETLDLPGDFQITTFTLIKDSGHDE